MQTLMRLVSLTIFAQWHLGLSVPPKADWKTLTQGLKSKDLVTQVSAYNSINKPKAKVAPPMDKAAIKQNLEDELQKKMAERELKMEAHHDSAPLKHQVQAVMSADKQLKHQMEQQMHEKEVRDKMRHEKSMKEKLQKAAGSVSNKRKAAPKPIEEPLEEIPRAPPRKPVEEPLPEIPKALPRKKLRAPVVETEPQEVEQEVAIPRSPPTRKASAPEPQPAASVHVGTMSQDADELPMPSWGPKRDSASDNGASARKIGGNPWNDVGGRRQHKQSDADDVQAQVEKAKEEELKVGHLPKLPVSTPRKTHRQVVQESQELAAHFENGNGVARFSANRGLASRAPAPGPGPAPGPAPWTEDPEWMIDGARGDKTRTAPIGNQFQGLASIPQPEQGFHGRPIVHEDMETMTGDWGSEFGPKGPSSAYRVCKEHPKSYWCRTHLKELSAGEDFGGVSTARAPASEDEDDDEEDEAGAPGESGAVSPPWKKSDASHMNAFMSLTAIAMVFLAM